MSQPRTKVTPAQRRYIQKHYRPHLYSVARLVRETGLPERTVWRVVKEGK